MSELKQVLLIRTDIKMSKGKIAAQASHAAVEASLQVNKKLLKNWRSQGMKKIALKVESKEELQNLINEALNSDLTAITITDAGHTELEPGTMSCGAIGPGPEVQIDKITGKLKPL